MSQLTIEDIAELAGVSRSTVSRVLNDHPSVRPGVRDRVWQIINEQGYAPQAAARNLVNQRTQIIGVLFPRGANLTNPIFASIGQGIGQECARKGYTAMLSLGLRDMEENVLFNMLRSRHFDGIVLISSDINDPLPLFLKEARIPYTRIGHDPNTDDLKWVDVDNVDGAYKAVNHLISLGHRRIAIIKGPAQEVCTPDRFEGYKKALQEVGLPLDPALVYESRDWLHTSGYAAMKRFLQLDQPPTAVFSSNDMMAAGTLHALYEHGLQVPQDMAIVGFDDVPQTTVIIPPLTTIRQPSAEMGARATEMLIDQLESNDSQPTHLILPTTLVVRQSCGASRQGIGASQASEGFSTPQIASS
ncbi:MAG TPA: LacI family DNA-binding transcriptional regulator [Ktedonobacteraceae bacterium]|nr:LacI family DNA-binding transcriptional regulator [Ktedonobacteraceae bacterium]